MYSIQEVSKKIGVSRQSIYNKIEKQGLQQYVKDSDRGKVITEKGFKILKGMFSEYIDSKQKTIDSNLDCKLPVNNTIEVEPETVTNQQESEFKPIDNLHVELTTDYISSLKSEIEHLKGIISDHSRQNDNLTRLLENSQVLMKQHQDKIFLLENPPEEKADPIKEKSFFEKLRYVFKT